MEELRKKTHRKVDYHLQKAYVDENDFYSLIKEFFLELLEKNYEPTYEELIRELYELKHDYLTFNHEQREQAVELLRALSEAEYTGDSFSQEEAKQLLEAFKELTTKMTTYSEHSIEQELHRGFAFLEQGNKSAAEKVYKRAREMYENLSSQQQAQYHADISELYNRLTK